MAPCFHLLGLTPSGLLMGLSSTLIYTSELILCSIICVPCAMRHNIHMRSKELPFMGHMLTSKGLKADLENIRAVQEMPTPTDIAGVQRFISFTNYLSHLSEVCMPLCQLTVQNVEWFWTDIHDRAVSQVKFLLLLKPQFSSILTLPRV